MNGVQYYLWRAVDENGVVIDILVQPKRDRWAALRFFRKLLHVAARSPRVIITDKLRSYSAARKLIMPDIEHRQSRNLNNRVENSHQPTRVRERQMKRFKSSEQAQRFLSVFESINAPFRLRRHLLSATGYSATAQTILSSLEQHCPRGTRCIASRLRLIPASPHPRVIKLTMPNHEQLQPISMTSSTHTISPEDSRHSMS